MSKNVTNSSKFVLIILIILVITFQTAHPQNTNEQTPRAIPKMWVSKAFSIERELWFRFGALAAGKPSKERVLNRLTSNPPKKTLSAIFPIAAFDDLIHKMETDFPDFKGLNVYITAFNKKWPGPLNQATIKNKELILVFAPAKKIDDKPADLGKYYVINQDDNKCYELKGSIKTRWDSIYLTDVVKGTRGLATTIENGKSENEITDPYTHKKITCDTRSVYYPYNDFIEFIDSERVYQNRNSVVITDIGIFFGSYPDTGIGANEHHYPEEGFKNRLIILFEFIDKDKKIFYIDDTEDFPDRLKVYSKFRQRKNAGDNGTLCPPCENCPAGFVPPDCSR